MSVTETVTPSVRGHERAAVVVLLIGSAGATGALAGFALGLAAQLLGVPSAGPSALALLVVAGVAADLAWRRLGRPRPLSVGRQVPQSWGRLFGPRVVALLYGGRLGVGPLTMLNTWLWWASALGAASLGAWPSATVGMSFGVARVALMALAAKRLSSAMAPGMARLRRREAAVWRASNAGALLLSVLAVLLLGACSGSGGGDGVGGAPARAASSSTSPPETAAPASTTTTTIALDNELAAVLLADPPDGFVPTGEPDDSGPLDLEEAAAVEPDSAAERSVLETRRFQRGYSRSWRHADGATVVAFVYQFADAAGAVAYLVDGFLTLEGFGAQFFEVPAVTGARGFSQADSSGDQPQVVHGVGFTRGNRFFLVFRSSLGSTATPDDARALAETQAALAEAG